MRESQGHMQWWSSDDKPVKEISDRRGYDSDHMRISRVVIPGRAWWPASEAAAEEQTEAQAREPLPFHLILGRLPVRQIFQLPCVCKDWYSMLAAGEALLSTGEEYWFVMAKPPRLLHHGHGQRRVWDFVAFSSHSKFPKTKDRTFFQLPLQSPRHRKLLTLLGGVHCTRLAMYTAGSPHDKSCPCLASAGGLMCAFVAKRGASNDYHVIVFNLLTGAVKLLPPVLNRHLVLSNGAWPREPRFCYIYMAFDDQDPDRYYIMLTHEDTYRVPAYFEVFDSRSDCWKVGRNPKPVTAEFRPVSEGDFIHESLFEEDLGPTLFAYHAADDVWSKVCTSKCQDEDVSFGPTFLKYKGRLLRGNRLHRMVGMESITLGFVVFELQPVDSEAAIWIEVARTPEHLWQWVNMLEWNHIVKAEGSLFYMEVQRKDKGQFRSPLVYDLMQDLWYVFPSNMGSTNLGSILVHRPRLSMRLPHLIDEDDCCTKRSVTNGDESWSSEEES